MHTAENSTRIEASQEINQNAIKEFRCELMNLFDLTES